MGRLRIDLVVATAAERFGAERLPVPDGRVPAAAVLDSHLGSPKLAGKP